MLQGEPLDEKMITSPKVITRELAASGGQAMPLLEGNQATLVTPQIIVTAQQEQTKFTVNRTPHRHKNERTLLWGIDTSIARLHFLLSTLLLKIPRVAQRAEEGEEDGLSCSLKRLCSHWPALLR
jgi:hypothetical protein